MEIFIQMQNIVIKVYGIHIMMMKSPLFGLSFIFVVHIEILFKIGVKLNLIQKQVLMAKNAMRLMNLIPKMPTLQIYPTSNVTLMVIGNDGP